jgi:hypothetical protein
MVNYSIFIGILQIYTIETEISLFFQALAGFVNINYLNNI